MKPLRTLCVTITSAAIAATALSATSTTEPDPGQVEISVGRLLEQGHYTRHKLDDEMSKRLLQYYLETLDYSRLFFTQKDIDAFKAKYNTALDDDILLGNPEPAYDIFDLYKKRVEDRVAKIKQWIATEKFDFKSNRTVLINRQKAPWPKDDAEADQLWHDRVEGELLQEKLSDNRTDTPEKIVTRRYDQILRNLHEQTHEDALDLFLTSLAQSYDPHSEYMSKSELDNFQINMKLSLVGIGAVLHSEDGYAKIMELVTGGPAQKEGHLKVGDRITAVAQGDGDFVDVIDMKLDKVVSMIRGKKGTTVRLQVIPAHATDPSARKIIEIVRDEVKLKDQEAKAEIIEKPDGKGNVRRLGWITLPSFYADMDHAGMAGSKSTTRDVLALLNRLKKENISGLIIDLRRNGGGSLEEAVNLTGLFIKKGPVVQAKDANGKITVSRDRDPSIAYDGPLIILTNTLSASASEIFAGALQDYGRAVIVGDHHTFGKGTVQTMLEIGRFIPFLGGNEDDAGALKLTIQKFYRVAGGSTQLHGVDSDVVLPSIYDLDNIGESSLKGPMPYDTVPPADFEKVTDHPLFLDQLRARSAARVAVDPEFKYVEEDLAKLKKKFDDNRVSLNEQVRRDEIAKDKAEKEKRIAERAKRHIQEPKVYTVTLDNVDKPELELVKNDISKSDSTTPDASSKDSKAQAQSKGKGKKGVNAHKEDKAAEPKATPSDTGLDDDDPDMLDEDKGPQVDEVRNETLNILGDLIDLSKSQKTAASSANTPKPQE